MAHPIDVHVGDKLRQRRWMAGITQQQLGDSVGTKFQQIQKYESGANRISASRLWDIANALDVPVSFFFEGLDGQIAETSEATATTLNDKEAISLVRVYSGIPEEQRRKLLDLARLLGDVA
ncbi:MAG TPA: helix-turn-helix transcriptional regulator [Thermohalobaculum sp.]|nr:helix-turn-helix transcriptional regulator [Thermohalobaculum sp.]